MADKDRLFSQIYRAISLISRAWLSSWFEKTGRLIDDASHGVGRESGVGFGDELGKPSESDIAFWGGGHNA